MKEIKNEKELMEAMQEDAPMPPSVMSTGGYGNLGFDCGCGKSMVSMDMMYNKLLLLGQ